MYLEISLLVFEKRNLDFNELPFKYAFLIRGFSPNYPIAKNHIHWSCQCHR